MNLPFNIDTKDLSSFAFFSTVAYLLLVGYNLGESIKNMIIGGYSFWGLILIIIFLLLLFVGIIYLIVLIPVMKRKEILSDKLIQERIINEVIEQDHKLIQMKIMEREHLMKTIEWNRAVKEDEKLGGFKWRTVDSIAKQALDKDFYETTYGVRILGDKKSKQKK